MANAKKFIFNIEWAELLMDYPAEVRLEVYDAIIRYAQSGTLSELKPLAKMAFGFIKKEMDANCTASAAKSDKLKENGRKGGRPRKTENQLVSDCKKSEEIKNQKTNWFSDDNSVINNNLQSDKKETEKPKNQLVFEEKEKRNEKESFPPDPLYKEKENKKEKEAAAPLPPRGDEAAAIEKQVEIYKSKQIWKEQIQLKFRMDGPQVDAALDEFALDMNCQETKITNFPALFTSWLNKKNNGCNRRTPDFNNFRNENPAFKGKITPQHGLIL